MRRLLIPSLLIVAAGCASQKPNTVSAIARNPLPVEQVRVFYDAGTLPDNREELKNLRVVVPGTDDAAMQEAMKKLKEESASAGGNAVLVRDTSVVKDVILGLEYKHRTKLTGTAIYLRP